MQWMPLKLDLLPAISIETEKTIELYQKIAVEAEKGDSRQQIKLNELKEQISRRIVQLEQLYDLHCHDQRISLFHRLKLQLMKALTSKQNHQDDQKRDSLQTMERYSMQASSGRMSERLEPLVDGSLERNPKERKDLKPTQSYKPLQNQTNESNLSERKTSAAYINGKLMLQPTGTQSGAKLKQTAQAKPGKEEKPQPLTDIKKTLNGKRPSHPPKEYPKKGIEPPKKQIAHDKLSEASSSTTHIKPASSFKLLPKEVLPDERMTRPAINLQKQFEEIVALPPPPPEVVFTIKMTKDEYLQFLQAKQGRR